MAITRRNIKKWFLMLFGRSVLHVNQGMGKVFKPNIVSGYFNDLTEKVLKQKKFLNKGIIPFFEDEKGEKVNFPVGVFQYALGCYDLFLLSKSEQYYSKFLELSDWAVDNQDEKGGWNNFYYIYPDRPYGAMCQGEGSSLLLRAYMSTGNIKYLKSAEKSIDFMLGNLNNSHICEMKDDDLILLEYSNKPAVLNGWIFALFGLYDLFLVTKNDYYYSLFSKTINTLIKLLPKFDNSYWSMYDLDGRISSPFYHKLHIAQLKALFLVTDNDIFKNYYTLFEKYRKNPFKRFKAFVIKVKQKIKE